MALSWMPNPTGVEPVNERALILGSVTSVSPTVPPDPVTMLITPSGRPASARMRTRAAALREASVAGLMTMALPQIRAGAIFQVGIARGKFHGVIRATSPTGSRIDEIWTPGRAEGGMMPGIRQPSEP